MIRLASNYLALGGITYALSIWLIADASRAAEIAVAALVVFAMYNIGKRGGGDEVKRIYIYPAVCVVMPYLAVSFVLLDYNVANWSMLTRGILAAVTLFAIPPSIFFAKLADELEK